MYFIKKFGTKGTRKGSETQKKARNGSKVNKQKGFRNE